MPFVYITSQDWLDWYYSVFTAIIGISSLGAGFVFSIIFAKPDDPREGITTGHVRRCLIISWILFVTSLSSASFATLFVKVNKSFLKPQLDANIAANGATNWNNEKLMWFVVVLMLFEQLLPIAAFMAAIEAIRAYDLALGAVAYGLIGFTAMGIIAAWLFQNLLVLACPRERIQLTIWQ
jgi:hypothetical protein